MGDDHQRALDRLRYGYSHATLERVAYLAWRGTKGEDVAERLRVLLADLDRPVSSQKKVRVPSSA